MSKMTKTIAVLGVVAGLGVAALPLSSYAATRQVDISATVMSSIALSTDAEGETADAKGTLDLGNVTPGSSVAQKALNVTVATNSTAGYEIKLIDAASDAALVDSVSGDKIPTATTVAKGKTAWGVKGGELGTDSWHVVPAQGDTALLVKDHAAGEALTDGSETTALTFGVSVAEGAVAAGTYTSTVVLTATSK